MIMIQVPGLILEKCIVGYFDLSDLLDVIYS